MNQNTDIFNRKETSSPSSKTPESMAEERLNNRMNLLSSEQINHVLNTLTSPRFLGSIHIKESVSNREHLVNNIIDKNLEKKISKSLKSSINNPITRFLISVMILFNVLWILFIYLL